MFNMKTHLPVYFNSNNKAFKIAINKNKININDQIQNRNNLIGIITELNNNYAIISWDDGTFERIRLNEFRNLLQNKELIKISNTGITKQIKKSINISTSSIKDLVNMAIEKGIIDNSDKELEILKLESFDQQALNEYKNNILNFNTDGEVYSLSEDEANDSIAISKEEQEAMKMLNTLRPKKHITATSLNDTESRSLVDVKDFNNYRDISFSNIDSITTPPTFEESLLKLADNENNENNNIDIKDNDMSLDDIISQVQSESKIKQNNNKIFLNTPFQGLTRPLITGANKDNINSVNTAFSELFSPEMWSINGR